MQTNFAPPWYERGEFLRLHRRLPTLDRLATRRAAFARGALGLLAVLPALVLGLFGLHSLRREQDLALIDARKAAADHAAALSAALERLLLEPLLPSPADVQAFIERPGAPTRDPTGIAGPGSLALLLTDSFSYPDLASPPSATPLDPQTLPPDLAQLWASTSRAPGDPGLDAWRELARRPGHIGSIASFRLGRALLESGRTAEARAAFERAAWNASTTAGETGLPIDVLALRGLLQVTEIDPNAAAEQVAWLDALCHRVLVRWRLPAVLLQDVEGLNPDGVRQWKLVARRHEAVRHRLRPFTNASPVEWMSDSNRVSGSNAPVSSSSLLTSHPIPGGRWILLRDESAIRLALTNAAASAAIPSSLAASVVIAGREFSLGPSGDSLEPFNLARAPIGGDDSLHVVQLALADPDGFFADTRQRAFLFAILIAGACALAVFAVLAALRAYDRQRRLAELQSDFVASVSHELRAPLASIRLMIEELTDLPAREADRRGEYLRLMLQQTSRLGLLVENVLRHARLERPDARTTRATADLRTIVHEAVAGLQPCADDRRVRLRTHLPDHAVLAVVDDQALRQVIINLVDNALKHSPPESTIDITLDLQPTPEGSRARIHVRDQGAGIPPADHARIFESFYRRGSELRRETGGVGLGLALVKRIVTAHQGSVRVDSEPGAGARFTVEIPGVPPHPS